MSRDIDTLASKLGIPEATLYDLIHEDRRQRELNPNRRIIFIGTRAECEKYCRDNRVSRQGVIYVDRSGREQLRGLSLEHADVIYGLSGYTAYPVPVGIEIAEEIVHMRRYAEARQKSKEAEKHNG